MKVKVWQDEMKEYDVWKTIPKPTIESMIDSKQVIDESIEENKAKFVARGFYQKEGIDLDKDFL